VREKSKILVFVTLILFSSCGKSKIEKYIEQNYNVYTELHKTLTDSTNSYLNSHLKSFLQLYNNPWQIDSFICVNSKNDKLVATINSSIGKCKECWSDDVTKILGKKVNNKWYFFVGGGTLVVPRESYGKTPQMPLTLTELSQIAHKEMFGENCLIKKDGEYVVNDAWVDQHFYNKGICADCKTIGEYDSVHWKKILDKWNHKFDPKEFEKEKLQ
jgi:hypothetical protein